MKEVLERYIECQKESSMFFWWPRVKDIPVPKPKTVLIPWNLKENLDFLVERVEEAVPRVGGFPVFVRTDHTSGKHEYVYTCFIPDRNALKTNIHNLVSYSTEAGILGVPVNGFAVREYIEPDYRFKAFNGLPIAPEVRVFVRDGEVLGWIFYWPEDAISFWKVTSEYQSTNWKEELETMRQLAESESEKFLEYARKLTPALDKDWSLDFMRGKDGVWYFIDAARAPISWGYDQVGGEVLNF